MVLVKKLLAASFLIAVTSTVFADSSVIDDGYIFKKNQLIPSGVRAEVGSTGYGGALQWTASPYVGLALGYTGGNISWSDDIKIDGSKYDVDMKNKNIYLNAEIHPWGTSNNTWAQGVYIAAGAAYLKNDYDLDRRVDGTRAFTVNNTDFLADAGGVHINGKMEYKNSIAPYLGIGLAPKFGKNWGVFGEVGAYYTGNPNVELHTVSGSATNTAGTTLENELANEAHKIANDDKYAWLPVAKLGVNFYW